MKGNAIVRFFNVILRASILVIGIMLFHDQLFGQAEVRIGAGTQTCVGTPITFQLQGTQSGANPVATNWIVHGSDYEIEGGGGTANYVKIVWNNAQSTAGATVYYTAYGGNYSGPASKIISITSPTKAATVSLTADQAVVCQSETINFFTSTNSTSVYYKWFVDDVFFAGGNIPQYSVQTLSPGIHTVHVTMLSTECVTNPDFLAISTPITVSVRPFVQTPSIPVGPNTYCIGSGMNSTYTTSATGADSFNWTIDPQAAGIVSVVANGEVIIDWNDSFASQNAQISVLANGCSGPSSTATKLVQMYNRLQTPSIPEGTARRCQGSASDIYTASAGNAEAYSWRIEPSSAGNISSEAKVINGNLVSEAAVNWSAVHYGQARIFVRATGCGMEQLESYIDVVTVETASTPLPSTPATPTGLLARCQGEGSTEYSTAATNADRYSWSISPTIAGTIDDPEASSIAIEWSELFNGSAEISVTAINCRGASEFSVVEVNTIPLVTTISIPEGPFFNAVGSTSQFTASADFAESYSWSIYPAVAGIVEPDGTVHWSDSYAGEAEVRVSAFGCNGSTAFSSHSVRVYDKSFLRETTVLIPGQVERSLLENIGISGKNSTITYYDGLGRPEQIVRQSISPNGNDIIKAIEFDELGRESVRYLPFVSETDNGSYRVNVTGKAKGGYASSKHYEFYNSQGTDIARSEFPFAVTMFEPSPLNRPLKIGAAGTSWQPNSDFNSFEDKSLKKRYSTNGVDEVYMFIYNDETSLMEVSLPPVFFSPGRLYANKGYDEHNSEVIEYVDMHGRLICRKLQYKTKSDGTKLYAQTYYVYDDFGNLVVVLPPEAIRRIESIIDSK